jgi:hypothetical protein
MGIVGVRKISLVIRSAHRGVSILLVPCVAITCHNQGIQIGLVDVGLPNYSPSASSGDRPIPDRELIPNHHLSKFD